MAGIGIDFGTSNSTAAFSDGSRQQLIALDQGSAIMPTAVHFDRELKASVGRQAIDQYVDENCGRRVELTPEVIGKATLVVGDPRAGARNIDDSTMTQDVYGDAMIDRAQPGRLFRGVKRLLGRADIKRLMVFQKPFRVVALVTPILLAMRNALAAEHDLKDCAIYLGHPVLYEGTDNARNQTAFARMIEASGHAGLPNVHFYPEPVAATLSFLDRAGQQQGHALTIDFGGGTLDLSVVAYRGSDFQVLATRGIGLGGDHIDQLLFREILFPLLGQGEKWTRTVDGQRVNTLFPFADYETSLLNWAVTYTLNQNRYLSPVLERSQHDDPAAEKFRRLRELITRNLSYVVFQRIRDTKAALSSAPEAELDIPELDINYTLTRDHMDHLLAGHMRQLGGIMDDVLAAAGVPPDQVDVVLRTGGSSLLTQVQSLLAHRFPGRVLECDPFTAVAQGLAIAAQRRIEPTPLPPRLPLGTY